MQIIDDVINVNFWGSKISVIGIDYVVDMFIQSSKGDFLLGNSIKKIFVTHNRIYDSQQIMLLQMKIAFVNGI